MRMNLRTLTLAALLAGASSQAETFQNLEAVDASGFSTWAGSYPLTVMGVILNDPGEMLDATPNFIPWNNGASAYQLGGQWQSLCAGRAAGRPRRSRMLDGAGLR